MSALEMPAGRELDALVAEKVMGWRLIENLGAAGGRVWKGHGGGFGDYPEGHEPPFSTDIAAAWEVVEKMQDGGWQGTLWWAAAVLAEGDWGRAVASFFQLSPPPNPKRIIAEISRQTSADTAPLAICRAALMAVAADTNNGGEG